MASQTRSRRSRYSMSSFMGGLVEGAIRCRYTDRAGVEMDSSRPHFSPESDTAGLFPIHFRGSSLTSIRRWVDKKGLSETQKVESRSQEAGGVMRSCKGAI